MDALAHQVAERGIDFALALDAAEVGEDRTLDSQREMAFATRVVTGVPDMLMALVLKIETRRAEGGGESLDHFAGDGAGGSDAHRA